LRAAGEVQTVLRPPSVPAKSFLSLLLLAAGLGLSGCETRSADLGGVHYCVFESDAEQWWYGVSAQPCEAGVPAGEYVRARDLGLGGGFTLVADRCESPTVLYLGPNEWEVSGSGAAFEARELTMAEMDALVPDPACQTVVTTDGVFAMMVARDWRWQEVRLVR
jgi:hypothetical protein